MGGHMLPLIVYVFEGGGLLIVAEFKFASLCLKLGIYVIRVLKFQIAKNYRIFLGEIKLGCREVF